MRKRIIKCMIALIVIIGCIVLGNVIKSEAASIQKEEFQSSLLLAYATIIGSIVCMVIGLAIGYIAREVAEIGEQRRIHRVIMGITVVYAVFIIILGVDWILGSNSFIGLSRFVFGVLGTELMLFVLYYGRFVFIVLGLLDMLFWPRKKILFKQTVQE